MVRAMAFLTFKMLFREEEVAREMRWVWLLHSRRPQEKLVQELGPRGVSVGSFCRGWRFLPPTYGI